MFTRPVAQEVLRRTREPRRFIQVLAGPRQSGKTTLASQVIAGLECRNHYASADGLAVKDPAWVADQWETARSQAAGDDQNRGSVLFLDEVQKVTGWSEAVKRLWDEDTMSGLPVRVVILGSSPLLVARGLSESLAGRFEVIRIGHWSYAEMREAFGWGLEQYVYFGGYPGSATLVEDEARWRRYILDSLVETTVSRDVLLMTRVDKPALLRSLFELGCHYSGQVLSYQKMIGQLQDAGSTVTLAHYLQLLQGAGLVAGLAKYSGREVRQRASSPKLLVLNTALMSAMSGMSFAEARRDTESWGRRVESAVGATLANGVAGTDVKLSYWAGRNREVDFVLGRGSRLAAIEVKSGRRRTNLPGMAAFCQQFEVKRKLLVGAQGMPLEEFLLTPPTAWVE